ncbi:hypothetical protein BJV78DRAFT_1252174 [Lactifluus subvellereus]|nr:hypothetical protein BJV78DRAFT_1252174 [Lactifluus subvellereus]
MLGFAAIAAASSSRQRVRWKRSTWTLTLLLHTSRSSSRVVERVHSPDSSTNQTRFVKSFCTRGPYYPLLPSTHR